MLTNLRKRNILSTWVLLLFCAMMVFAALVSELFQTVDSSKILKKNKIENNPL